MEEHDDYRALAQARPNGAEMLIGQLLESVRYIEKAVTRAESANEATADRIEKRLDRFGDGMADLASRVTKLEDAPKAGGGSAKSKWELLVSKDSLPWVVVLVLVVALASIAVPDLASAIIGLFK